jgi:hypothetical protein
MYRHAAGEAEYEEIKMIRKNSKLEKMILDSARAISVFVDNGEESPTWLTVEKEVLADMVKDCGISYRDDQFAADGSYFTTDSNATRIGETIYFESIPLNVAIESIELGKVAKKTKKTRKPTRI